MKNKNIYKGSWWFNNRRKHPSFIVKSNNNNYFEIRILSHKRKYNDDIELVINPNPIDKNKAYIQNKKYVERNKKSFGKKLSTYKLNNHYKKKLKK